jgi:heptosyltransferase III
VGERGLAHRSTLPRRLSVSAKQQGFARRGSALRAALVRAAGRPRPDPSAQPPQLPSHPRVLAIRPDHVGDILFTGPALTELVAASGAAVTLLVGPWGAAAARLLPGKHTVTTLPFPWFDRRPKLPPGAAFLRLFTAARQLRGQFDAAITYRDDDWWGALLARAAGIPVRIGFAGELNLAGLTHALPFRTGHVAAAGVALSLATVGRRLLDVTPHDYPLRVTTSPAAAATARGLLMATGLNGARRLIVVHPGSGSPVKRWAPDRWGELLRTRPTDVAVAVSGSEEESTLAEATAKCIGGRVASLAGRTSLPELAALLAEATVVVGPDSGPLHLAVAVGTPTVHLFGPASAARFGPWGPAGKHRVVNLGLPCSPCGRLDWPAAEDHPCVRAIPVAAVGFALWSLIGDI